MSLPSCMAMSPATSQLSFVMTLSHLSSPFCLHCLASSFQFFRSSRDPNAKHRRATGHLVLPPPSPSLRLSLPDVSLLLLQRCFCLIFFQSKKVVCKVSSKEGTPLLVPSRSLHAMAHRHPPQLFSISFCFQMLFLHPLLLSFLIFYR